MRILLVDDVQIERMQLAIRLKQQGHTVEVASSGREALELYPEFNPELVLLDISMPDMNGFEVSQQIRTRFPEWIPIIFLSSHEEPAMIAKAIEAGGDDYLIKPVDKTVLSSKLVAMQRIAFMRRELNQKTAELAKVNKELEKLASEDGLTQVSNRRYSDARLAEMIAVHGRHGLPLTVILLDVDNFKPFNDNYGHIKGDQCLIAVAQALTQLFTRSGELVGRYGGEEFVVLLGHTDVKQAETEAKRITQALATLNFPHEYSPTASHVTVSQGIACIIPKGRELPDDFYTIADKALYQAKHQGKNCFVISGDSE
ncbi:GGDEF domain-containing response regulator [Vibrio sonorensis]|uniref:GGDEF domain-containing response regulator n=1 Tax=Vibrio sonorensis TaxID=1004316 RepID=UPI0008DA5E75|nr:diguanylate cyclase [Vibrio sonorensis]